MRENEENEKEQFEDAEMVIRPYESRGWKKIVYEKPFTQPDINEEQKE